MIHGEGSLHRVMAKGPSGDRRSHVELAIYWSPKNIQRVLALVDTDAECFLIMVIQTDLGNPMIAMKDSHLGAGCDTDSWDKAFITMPL